jgi:hypothetical protein
MKTDQLSWWKIQRNAKLAEKRDSILEMRNRSSPVGLEESEIVNAHLKTPSPIPETGFL